MHTQIVFFRHKVRYHQLLKVHCPVPEGLLQFRPPNSNTAAQPVCTSVEQPTYSINGDATSHGDDKGRPGHSSCCSKDGVSAGPCVGGSVYCVDALSKKDESMNQMNEDHFQPESLKEKLAGMVSAKLEHSQVSSCMHVCPIIVQTGLNSEQSH